MNSIRSAYQRWLDHPGMPEDLKQELLHMRDDPGLQEDCFYRSLSFGTGGLRGTMGAGSNRMNDYTVLRATRGLAKWLHAQGDLPSCAIGFDNRHQSRRFAQLVAAALADSGVRVHLFEELCPTPMLSFAVRYLRCDGGVMITASHNPKEYNGYKVYDATGCQILDEAAEEIKALMEAEEELVPAFPAYDDQLHKGFIRPIGRDVQDAYHAAVLGLSVMTPSTPLDVVYTPLHGAGLRAVRRVLGDLPNIRLTVVPEQEHPDGSFPTVPKPNPEDPAAMALASELMLKEGADICLATDPDCDRLGVGVRLKDGHRFLSGNEIGVLMLHFICEARTLKGTMPECPTAVKTIVTTPMADAIAQQYQVKLIQVLTGFKYIGNTINRLARDGQEQRYILGFEESYGYLSGTHVRDKDAVNAALLVCEMASYYKGVGSNLWEAYEALCERYGRFNTALETLQFEGAQGAHRLQRVMASLREAPLVAGLPIAQRTDYLHDDTGLPPSDVLVFQLEGDRTLVVRPSGTEPLLKLYLSLKAGEGEEADAMAAFRQAARQMVEEIA